MTNDKMVSFRVPYELYERFKKQSEVEGRSISTLMRERLEGAVVAVAPTSATDVASAQGTQEWRLAKLVALIGPTAGYPVHGYEYNVKKTISDEDWIRRYSLPFEVNDIVAACYAAGNGDPWAGFINARVREQLNDTLDDVGSRPAVLRARLRDIARLTNA